MQQLSILVLSSLYPPHYIGGYELGCRDIVDGLRSRGHDVRVLTSTYQLPGPQVDGHVYRWLKFELLPRSQSSVAHQWALFGKELHNRRELRRLLRQFKPDLVYVWSIHHASLSLVRMAQRRLLTTAFISDHWLASWEVRDSWSFLPRHPGRRAVRLALGAGVAGLTGTWLPRRFQLRHAQFASEFLRSLTAPTQPALSDAPVIHWGIDPAQFDHPRQSGGGQRLLYAGQVAEHKGVHTAIEALALLHTEHGRTDATLTIVGAALFPAYQERLQQLIARLGLQPHVRWAGKVARSDLAAIYAEHDVLVFPSVWDEPFSITVLEALAAGLAVVASSTGGTSEIIVEGQTGLLFPKEDAPACAAALLRLLDSPELREHVAQQGQELVRRSFTLTKMIDQIEADLEHTISHPQLDQGLAAVRAARSEDTKLVRSSSVKNYLHPLRRAAGRAYGAARPHLIKLARAVGIEKPARALVRRLIVGSRRREAWRWPSETSKCRARLNPYCVGYGADLGFGGDPINDRAVRVDMPQPYTQVGKYPVQLGGNADNLVWFADESLDYLYSSHLLEDFIDTKTVLVEWLRVLKVGGRLIIYCPDEQRFRAHCQATGQPYNPHHKHANFSIDFVKQLLAELGQTSYLYENPDVDGYSWEVVCVKTRVAA